MRQIYITLILGLLADCWLPSTTWGGERDEIALLDGIIAARAQLPQNYRLRLKITSRLYSTQNPAADVVTIDVWRKKTSVRTDIVSEGGKGRLPGRRIIARNCEKLGYGFNTTVGLKDSVMLTKFVPLDAKFDERDGYRVDWRYLGLLHDDVLGYTRQPPTATFDRLRLSPILTTAENTNDGSSIETLSTACGPSCVWKCQLNLNLGPNPVFHDVTDTNQKIAASTKIDYAKLTGGYGWFPSKIDYSLSMKDRIIRAETVTVEIADFSTAVSDVALSLAGMNLDDGQPVMLPGVKTTQDVPLWRNGKLDATNTLGKSSQVAAETIIARQPPPISVPDIPPPSNRHYYLAAAAAMATLGIIALVFARRRQS